MSFADHPAQGVIAEPGGMPGRIGDSGGFVVATVSASLVVVDFGNLAQGVDELNNPAPLVIRRFVLAAVGVGGGEGSVGMWKLGIPPFSSRL